MLDSTWKKRIATGTSLFTALLLSSVVGCGPGDSGEDDEPVATPTPAGTTPTPIGNASDAFPIGDYYFQSVYTFIFADIPYIMTMAGGLTGTSPGGNYGGDFVWVLWNDRDSYEADEGADCLLYEALTATQISAGNSEELDYESCLYCDPFSSTISVFESETGCSEEIFDWWYFDEEAGEYDYEFLNEFGYRDASDGWPSDFDEFADILTADGWAGTIYDLLLSAEGEFVPNYILLLEEEEDAAKRHIQNIKNLNPSLITEIHLDSPSDVKKFLKSRSL